MSFPDNVDLSKHLRYIQSQPYGGGGCWGYSGLMCWDIMNEMASPFSPNLSCKLWLNLHSRRDLWEEKDGIWIPPPPKYTYHKVVSKIGPEYWLFESFGNITEGTEMAFGVYPYFGPYPRIDWHLQGLLEAGNYKLRSAPHYIEEDSHDSFIGLLATGYPISISLGPPVGVGHVVTIVGYDTDSGTFRFVNPWGDKWGSKGFSTFTFEEIDNNRIKSIADFKDWKIDGASVFDIIPPKQVPVALISFHHDFLRSNVTLWLSVEHNGRRYIQRRIWFRNVPDNSRNLSYTVRLPRELIWPPSSENSLVLDLYDSSDIVPPWGKPTPVGEITEFAAAFKGEIIKSSDLNNGPIRFKQQGHLVLHIP
jgi:hypothetical protein